MARRKRWEAHVGELAVYPGQGVARIEAVQSQEVAGEAREFLVLRRLEDQSRILIPRDRVDQAGLRAVIKRRDGERVWEILRDRGDAEGRAKLGWNRQLREYQDKLRDGSIFDVAEVLRDLLRLQVDKELSLTERKLLEAARSQLVHELAAALRRDPDDVSREIAALANA